MGNLQKLEEIIDKKGLDAAVLINPANIQYFTGIRMIENPVMMLYVGRDGEKKLYVPVLEYYRVKLEAPKDIEVLAFSKSYRIEGIAIKPMSISEIFSEIIKKHKRIGVDEKSKPQLSNSIKLPDNVVDIGSDVWEYRMRKDSQELDRIKRAAEATARAIEMARAYIHEGITESELAGAFEYRARLAGIEEYAFTPLVLFKPANSYPHNLPGPRRLGKRDLILVDVGVKIGGYCSDITRMMLWRRPSREERTAIEAVEEAINNVVDKAEPGMKASEIDAIARNTLKKYGLDKYFIHGLGHGLGIEVHEPPYLAPGSNKLIVENMVFTIEPGVYVPGRFGVRIEEDAVMTKRGVRLLTKGLNRVLYA